MRWIWFPVVLATVAAPGATARADDDASDSEAIPPPVPRRVTVRLEGTTAHFSVRVGIDLHGDDLDTASITLPSHGVVTAAAVTIGKATHRLALTHADDASEQMYELRGRAEGLDPALAFNLSGGPGTLTIESLVPHAVHAELALDLVSPTCFYRDARYVEIPADWRDALDRSVVRAPAAPASEVGVNCGAAETLTWIALPSRELAAKPAGEARIETSGERLPLTNADVAHVELDLASQLGAVPSDLRTAIVIDASRSLVPQEAEAQRAIVQAYLAAVPHSEVQVIAYARTADALLPGWSPAATTGSAIDRAMRALPPRNGSNVDAGLAEAAHWLAASPGTRRVIMFSDELVASRLTNAKAAELAAMLPAGTLVHAVALDGFDAPLARYDDALFAPLALATEGMSVRGNVPSNGAVDATMLARPITFDDIKVIAADWTGQSLTETLCDGRESLAEGTSCAWWGQGSASSGAVTIEGMVWGHHVVRRVDPDPDRARQLARTLTATTGLDQAVQNEVEEAAHAVNAVWSLFAKWGGKDGYGTGSGYGCCLPSRGSSYIGHGSGGSSSIGRPPRLELRDQFQPVIDACHARRLGVALEVETTLEELVDVRVTVTGAGAGEAQMRYCITEGAWNTLLSIPNAPAYARTTVAF